MYIIVIHHQIGMLQSYVMCLFPDRAIALIGNNQCY